MSVDRNICIWITGDDGEISSLDVHSPDENGKIRFFAYDPEGSADLRLDRDQAEYLVKSLTEFLADYTTVVPFRGGGIMGPINSEVYAQKDESWTVTNGALL